MAVLPSLAVIPPLAWITLPLSFEKSHLSALL